MTKNLGGVIRGAAVMLLTSATMAVAQDGGLEPAGHWVCSAQQGEGFGGSPSFHVAFDEQFPLVEVNESDLPADYAPSHIRILLNPEGAVLTIGRVSGRYLASTALGEVVAQGRCVAPAIV